MTISLSSPVQFVALQTTKAPSFSTDKYAFRKDRGWCYLQKGAIWLLRKIGAYVPDVDRLTYSYRTVETGSFLNRLIEQRSALVREWAVRGERLLIGAKEYCELMSETSPIHYMLSFQAKAWVDDRMTDLRVTVIPWMSGMLVMPKLDDENQLLRDSNEALERQVAILQREVNLLKETTQ